MIVEQVVEQASTSLNTDSVKDEGIQAVLTLLAAYKREHPKAQIDVRRRYNLFLRIRIIDPDFKKLNRVAREEMIWPLLEPLPDEILQDITMLLLLTPTEAKTSYANQEFENPIPWPNGDGRANGYAS